MVNGETRYLIALSLIKNFGHLNARRLIEATGSAEAVFTESRKVLSKLKVKRHVVEQVRKKDVLELAEREIEFSQKQGIKILTSADGGYPSRMLHCPDSPLVLYIKGSADLNKSKILSVVGTRSASIYGENICRGIIADLEGMDVVVVSGLAIGIDSFAHEAAMKNGLETVAVLAHGLNRLYPQRNRKMAAGIALKGALVSDFASSSALLPCNFPARNRLIAGLADATIVVESGLKGGSLITAEIANSYNREVFAVPGKAGSRNALGCHWLIKNNKAALLESAEDLIAYMNWGMPQSLPRQLKLDAFDDDEEVVLKILRTAEAMKVDDLAQKAGIPISKIAAILLHLEFKNAIRSLPGRRYTLGTN